MKILQITYSLGPGGAERFVIDLSNELSIQGHEVTLCVLRDDRIGNFGFYKKEIGENIKYINLKIPTGLSLKNISRLYQLIKNEKPQIVHCHLNLVNYIFPLIIFFLDIRFFHTVHSDAKREVSNQVEYWLRRLFYSNKKMKAITISSQTTFSFVEYYKVKPYFEITNGRASPKPSLSLAEVKESIEFYRKGQNRVFIHVGTCSQIKNQKLLISTFNRIIQSGEMVVLLIIGSGFDSTLGSELKEMACDKIYFLGEKHNVFDYLLNADAFCLSSFQEGMPMSLIEALSCGCTPICTPVGGIINTITDGKTGYLSKTISESDYFNSILEYLNNPSKITRADLKELYYLRFSIEECAKKYICAYTA
jgi:glycosyltransferase involved in cell wall biosynthesis